VSTDWGGIIGTTVMAGVAIKTADAVLGRGSKGGGGKKKKKSNGSPF
jgi:hypothetical protein